MIDLNNLYSEKNIGIPMKVRMGNDAQGNSVYVYGRYYGHGYDGESIIGDDDYYLIAIVTPGGTLINGGTAHFDLIKTKEDFKSLNEYEEMSENPYYPFLKIAQDKYIKTFDYKKLPIAIKDYPQKWFEKRGLFEINEDIFGNGLSSLFSLIYERNFYFQKLRSRWIYNSGPIYSHHEEERDISIISSTIYDKYYSKYYSDYPWTKRDYFDTAFKKNPVDIKPEDYLVKFSSNSLKTNIKLGKIVDDTFVVNKSIPISDAMNLEEVNFDNSKFEFVNDFVQAIIDYKLKNRKFTIDQEDINIIVNQIMSNLKENSKVLIKK